MSEEFRATVEQQDVIAAGLEPTLVVAGAGSGKTATMAARIVHLVSSAGVQPHQVLGLTFTRKAAGELAARLRRGLAECALDPTAGEPTVSTYHAYATALCAEHAVRAGREANSRLVTPAVCWQLAARVVSRYDGPMWAITQGPDWVIQAVLRLSGELADHLRHPAEVTELSAQLRHQVQQQQWTGLPVRELLDMLQAREQLLPLVIAYRDLKAQLALVDHDDLVSGAASLAAEHPVLGEVERQRFAVVLLDEYQDTGHAQRMLLRRLFGGGHPVTAVGDPCQSIYGWRGASAGGLRAFPTDFPLADGRPAPVRHLSTSFRNPPAVLVLANRLAEPLRRAGSPTPELRSGVVAGQGCLVAAMLDSAQREASWLAGEVAALLDEQTAYRPGDVAVLVRRRSQMPLLRAALNEAGLPVEVIGLGGLLDVPEVADVVAALRAVGDPAPGPALARLLTGPRWRLGPADLAALGRRTAALNRAANPTGEPGAPPVTLADALDDPGERETYSQLGYRRVLEAGGVLRRLRQLAGGPLAELIDAAIGELRLDVELAALAGPAGEQAARRADLDAFRQAAADFAEAPGNLAAFLAYLRAAAEEEFGLPTAPIADSDTVKLLTVHAAKGLEWPVVALPGLADRVFPSRSRGGVSWVRCAAALPFPLRGDHDDLPSLVTADRAGLARFADAVAAREALEEDRLCYVAVTRAADVLLCSGYYWGEGKQPHQPSRYLLAAREAGAQIREWRAAPSPEQPNPLPAAPVPWPPGPPEPATGGLGEAAAMVAEQRGRPAPADSPWRAEVRLLLAESEAADGVRPVVLAEELTVSELVALCGDPSAFARSLRRPMPRPPAPAARRGTTFHRWLESVFHSTRLFDFDDLDDFETTPPEDRAGAELAALQRAFRGGPWWGRTPLYVETPFETPIGGLLLRGRIDAVYREPGGRYSVLDWKTGQPPSRPDSSGAVQLAVYRVALARLVGCPLDAVRAGLHYVRSGQTVWLDDIAGPSELDEILQALPVAAGE